MPTLLTTLQNLLGTARVLTGADAAPYCIDQRKRYQGAALCVVRPRSTEEVADIVRLCAQAGVAVVPQGGNTGLVGGATPDADGRSVVVSMQAMRGIRQIDAANQTMTVEAGCALQQVQQAAAQAGWLFPLSMASQGSCTIGGNLATNAGGTQVLRYGNARELCLGLEVVTAQGEIWSDLRGLRKNNTGYDLRNLFVGSEGTLGIITAATLKLYPQPRGCCTAWVALPSVQAAVDLLGLARQQLGAALTAFELMGQHALALVAEHFAQLPIPLFNPPNQAPHAPATLATPAELNHAPNQVPNHVPNHAPYYALLECADSHSEPHARQALEDLLQAALEQGLASDAAVAANARQSSTMWQVRESIPLAQAQCGLNVKHDITLPISAIAQFVQETDAALQQTWPGVRMVNFGHVGDGNLHYNVQAPAGIAPGAFLAAHESAINRLVFDAVHRFGGSISAEHGIGQLKRQTLPRYHSPVALGLMRQIKQALDPHNTMNPNRLL